MKTAINIWLTLIALAVGMRGFVGVFNVMKNLEYLDPGAAAGVSLFYGILILTAYGLVNRIWDLGE